MEFQQTERAMENFLDILRQCPLFINMSDHEIASAFDCLDMKHRVYEEGQIIFSEGDPSKYIGIVLSGSVQIERMDYYGNRSILTTIEPPQLFGEVFVCAEIPAIPVSVVASRACEILLLDMQKVVRGDRNECSLRSRLVFNLLKVVAAKNLVLNRKIEVTAKRSTREKLLAYLLLQAKQAGSNSFTIPYDRQELADYLGVERSGLSAVISSLKKEGVVWCRKNAFTLLKAD